METQAQDKKTPKQVVLEKYPNAKAESRETGWVISTPTKIIAVGSTAAVAWKAAAEIAKNDAVFKESFRALMDDTSMPSRVLSGPFTVEKIKASEYKPRSWKSHNRRNRRDRNPYKGSGARPIYKSLQEVLMITGPYGRGYAGISYN